MSKKETAGEKTCGTCEHYAYDEWYQSERICICMDSPNCGQIRERSDTCDSWEANRWSKEGQGPEE